jgi:hypothetical protein
MVPMFLGCSGANVVSGEDQTEAEKLAAELPSWCMTTCERLSACDSGGEQDCGCSSGSPCECTTPTRTTAACAADCEETLADYSKTTEQCADVGRRYLACVDTLGCAELNSEPPCLPPRSQLEACELDHDYEDPPQSGTGGTTGYDYPPQPSEGGSISYAGSATAGYAGTASGGSGVAGSATGGTGPVGPVVSCNVGFGSAGAAGSANQPSGPSVTCEEGRAACSDGHEYRWICLDDASGRNWCSCFLDNNPVGVLPSNGVCPSVDMVNAGCGWNLANEF